MTYQGMVLTFRKNGIDIGTGMLPYVLGLKIFRDNAGSEFVFDTDHKVFQFISKGDRDNGRIVKIYSTEELMVSDMLKRIHFISGYHSDYVADNLLNEIYQMSGEMLESDKQQPKDGYVLCIYYNYIEAEDWKRNTIAKLSNSDKIYVGYLYSHPSFGPCIICSVKQDDIWKDYYYVVQGRNFVRKGIAR